MYHQRNNETRDISISSYKRTLFDPASLEHPPRTTYPLTVTIYARG